MLYAVDSMLIRVGKILRMLGFDTYIRGDESFFKFLEKSLGRVVLTKRKNFPYLTSTRILSFEDSRDDESIVAFVLKFFQKPNDDLFLSRCLECNTEIILLSEQFNLHKCPTCNRIYWEGSHVARMKDLRDRILTKSR